MIKLNLWRNVAYHTFKNRAPSLIFPLIFSFIPLLLCIRVIRNPSTFAVIGEDAWKWIDWARIIAIEGFSTSTIPYKSPIYPLIFSLTYKLGIGYIVAGFLIGLTSLYIFTLFMLFTAEKMEGLKGQILALLLISSSMPILGYSLHHQPDGLFIAIEMVCLYIAICGITKPHPLLSCSLGALLSILSLTKINGILLIPPLLIVNLISGLSKERGLLRRTIHPPLFLSGLFLAFYLIIKIPPLDGLQLKEGFRIFFREEIRKTATDAERILDRKGGEYFPSIVSRLMFMKYKDQVLLDLAEGRKRMDVERWEVVKRFARFNMTRLYEEVRKTFPIILPLSIIGLLSLLLFRKEDKGLLILHNLFLLTPLLPMMKVWWEERHLLFLYPIFILFSLYTVTGIERLYGLITRRKKIPMILFLLILALTFLKPFYSSQKYLSTWLIFRIKNVSMFEPIKEWIIDNTAPNDFIMADDASLAVMTGRRYLAPISHLCVDKALRFMKSGDQIFLIVSQDVTPSILATYPFFGDGEYSGVSTEPYIFETTVRYQDKNAFIYRWNGESICLKMSATEDP